MIPFLICHFLKEYGLDDLSKMAYEKLSETGRIQREIDLDGIEKEMSYVDFLDSVPACIIDAVTSYISFFSRCRYYENGKIGIENLLRYKDKLSKLTLNIINELDKYSELYEDIEEIYNSNIFFGLRSFYNGLFEFKSLSKSHYSHFLNLFCRNFRNSSIVYSHQHINDSDYGLGGDPASVYLIKKDNTGNVLISGGDDGILKLWNIYTGNLITSIKKTTGDITDFDINSSNSLIAFCCGKGELILSFVIGNEWLPLAIISNPDRLTCVKFGYRKNNNIIEDGQIFQNSEILISGGDNAVISIYRVKDLFMNGVSHFLSKNRLKKWRDDTFTKFYEVFEKYERLLYSSYYSTNDNSLFYQSPPLYKIDIFPLSPKAFDICLNPVDNPGYSYDYPEDEYILFSVGASLDQKSSCEEITIQITRKDSKTDFLKIKRDPYNNGYALVFVIPMSSGNTYSKIQILDIPCKYYDNPDVSFANNSQDLVIASDDGTVHLWVTQKTTVCYYYSLTTYITEKIRSDSYVKKKATVNVRSNMDERNNEDFTNDSQVDFQHDKSASTVKSISDSRFIFRNDSSNSDSHFLNSTSNIVQFIDFIQWSCDDSLIIIANSVTQKSSLKRQRSANLVTCIESCISYFSRKSMRRILDIVLPNTTSRIVSLVAHPIDPGMALCLTYDGGVFVTTLKEQFCSIKKLSRYTHILFEHRCNYNPYLNGTWLKDGLGFVISQRLGTFEFYHICGDLNSRNNILTRTYRFSYTEQLFLGDFCEIVKDQIFWLINPNTRRPMHFFPRSVIVNRHRRMYPELLQPPIPKESPLGITVNNNLKFSSDLFSARIPYFDILDFDNNIAFSSELFTERAKKRMLYRERKYGAILKFNKIRDYTGNSYDLQSEMDHIDNEYFNVCGNNDKYNNSRVDNCFESSNNSIAGNNDKNMNDLYKRSNCKKEKKAMVESLVEITYPHFAFKEEYLDIFIKNYELKSGEELEIESTSSNELLLNEELQSIQENQSDSRLGVNMRDTGSLHIDQNDLNLGITHGNRIEAVSSVTLDYGTLQFSSTSESGDDSSLSDQSISDENETENDSDLTSEDSLYDEIKVITSNKENRRRNRKPISNSFEDNHEDYKEFQYRYYEISNLDFLWIPECEEEKNYSKIVCKLCNIGNTTIIGHEYLLKSNIEFKTKLLRPVLHGVNGSIDFGPLIGPFNYSLSTKGANENPSSAENSDTILEKNNFYVHTRCLITLPFLCWEVVKDKVYTNIFDIVNRMYSPDSTSVKIPNSKLTCTFFDTNVVTFPKTLKNCSFCNKYGATILCQGKKCNQQFHYHCSSLAYHSFPEFINSKYVSPRESGFYWCDIMSFFIYYCPKCIQIKNSGVPYNANRTKMIENGEIDDCKRNWLSSSETIANYTPQIHDSLCLFPGSHRTCGLDDLFFKSLLFRKELKRPSRRCLLKSDKQCDYIKCKLVNISYSFPGGTESYILAILTFSTLLASGKTTFFQLRCAPNDGPDYLVLEQDLEKGIHNLNHRFRPGQECFIFIDNNWHEVVIKKINPGIVWESVEVTWKSQTDNCSSIMVNPWEISECIYFPENKKNLDNADQLKRIFTWITTQTIGTLPPSFINIFNNHIPYYSKKRNENNPLYSNECWVMHYWKEIPLPFCFSKIIDRINKNYYRRLESLVSDILLIRSNCEHFNMNNNYFTQGIRTIEYELLRLIFGKRLPRYIFNGSNSLSEVKRDDLEDKDLRSPVSTETELEINFRAIKKRILD